MKTARPEALFEAFERQVAWCREPAPFTARLLDRSLRWLRGDAEVLAAFCALAEDPLSAAVPLRWAGALHHLALRGISPWAALWPPAPGAETLSDTELDAAVRQAWSSQRSSVQAALARPPQTNEVQRSAALLPGLLYVAAATARPLALLEIGASAGLNLWPERHRYAYGAWSWGHPASVLELRADWRGPVPAAVAFPLAVTGRAACDATPIDLLKADEALRLRSFVWPEQGERLLRLETAQKAVVPWMAAESVVVRAEPAASFAGRELALPRPGTTTVLMHSVVWQYLPAEQQAAISAAVAAAAAHATADAPLAWLRLEPPAPDLPMELRCTLWPGGVDHRLALAHAHGAWIEWLA
jgi:hypothetical protein